MKWFRRLICGNKQINANDDNMPQITDALTSQVLPPPLLQTLGTPTHPENGEKRDVGESEKIDDLDQLQVSRSPNDFYFLRIIGEGSFSTVYLVREVETNQEFAAKVLHKEQVRKDGKINQVLREKEILVSISYNFGNHPFIAKILYAFQDPKRLYFIISYAKNGELLEVLKRLGSFDDESTLFYASEIVSALEFLHCKCRIIHRDLKPENILIGEDRHLMVSDFGSAKSLEFDGKEERPIRPAHPHSTRAVETEMMPFELSRLKMKAVAGRECPPRSSFVGTAQYISPEVLNTERVGPECDYWALGAIIYQMISGQPPFRATNDYSVFKKIRDLEYQFPEGFPQVPKDLVKKFLVNNPSDRLGSKQTGGIEAIKAHPFFREVDWEQIFDREPPELKPYLPASTGEPEFYSEDFQPKSFDDEELLRGIEPGYESAQARLIMGECGGRLASFKISIEKQRSSPSSTAPPLPVQLPASAGNNKRQDQLAKQRAENKYHCFVDDHLILKSGLIDKKKGLFARRRMFLLTEGPHLYYVDPVLMVRKGEVPFSPEMRTEAKNFRTFFIHTPNRTYYLFDLERHALDWCTAIDSVNKSYINARNKGIQLLPVTKSVTTGDESDEDAGTSKTDDIKRSSTPNTENRMMSILKSKT